MEKRWYIVHAYSNFERKVAEAIKDRAKAAGLSDLFEEVLVPTEDVVEVRRGRKVQAERKFFPGYVLAKMDLTDEAFHLIKNTPKVTGFLGADNKPMPISDVEAERILHQVQEGIERPRSIITFQTGELIQFDAETVAGTGVHRVSIGKTLDADGKRIFGESAEILVAFPREAMVVTMGLTPLADGKALASAMKRPAAPCTPKRSSLPQTPGSPHCMSCGATCTSSAAR